MKISTDQFDCAIKLARQIEDIGGEGSQALIAGGAVRDAVMKREWHDVDIATNVAVDVLEENFKTNDIGQSREFGIVLVHFGDCDFEVAHFRADGNYDDGRHPDSVDLVNSFDEDAARRDFKMNALGMDVDGNIIDPHGGLDDIHNKVISTVGDPDKRFDEDYLRMLRAARFAARYDFNIDVETRDAIRRHAHKIVDMPSERIYAELYKSAHDGGHQLARFVELLRELHLLEHVLPEIHALIPLKHNYDFHPEGDVFPHVLECLRASKSREPYFNIAVLLHDVGKAVTYDFDEGRHSYKGHDRAGVAIIEQMAARLKIPNVDRDIYAYTAENHMKFHKLEEMSDRKIIELAHHKFWPELTHVGTCDEASRAHLFDPTALSRKLSHVARVVDRLGKKEELKERIAQFITGHKVIKMRPDLQGSEIGSVMNLIKAALVDSGFSMTQEQVDDLIRFYANP